MTKTLERSPNKKDAGQGVLEKTTKCTDSITTKAKPFNTKNPRHLRLLAALLVSPRPREHLDAIAGCSNAPDEVMQLRRKGLEIPCQRVKRIDIDGFVCLPGIYSLTPKDRATISAFILHRERKGRAGA